MRYGKDIVKRIVEELQKVPSVRHVCNKVGIDHSTFYRWIAQHFEFSKEVEAALMFGRKNINDAAEGVIISGIQRGDFRSATYWLSRNEERYIEAKQVRYFQYLEYWNTQFLKQKTPSDSPFDELFERYLALEKVLGPERGKELIEPIVDIICHTDAKLKDIFYSAYDEWKTDKLAFEAKKSKIPSLPQEKDSDTLDSPDQSVIP